MFSVLTGLKGINQVIITEHVGPSLTARAQTKTCLESAPVAVHYYSRYELRVA